MFTWLWKFSQILQVDKIMCVTCASMQWASCISHVKLKPWKFHAASFYLRFSKLSTWKLLLYYLKTIHTWTSPIKAGIARRPELDSCTFPEWEGAHSSKRGLGAGPPCWVLSDGLDLFTAVERSHTSIWSITPGPPVTCVCEEYQIRGE